MASEKKSWQEKGIMLSIYIKYQELEFLGYEKTVQIVCSVLII